MSQLRVCAHWPTALSLIRLAMGQFLSGVAPSGASEGDDSHGTPKNTRATVDPRSPTLEFDRTPVKVESTPQLNNKAAAGHNGGENAQQQPAQLLQLQHRALETTPATARERPRTLHQKLVAEKHKKMSAAEQQHTATTPTSY
ncbi:hypothetical protein PRIPAC_91679 [Pristionchus pacificus]|uniref:Uncharacterized protein n=1 Tax=Pristionchus pacificus TaxID=54126 RepID=A0A2A6CHV9_PRIPA|nr:hypothetical protein PRIPAC_91679 [Pristionchus pacificus]|eukprot:PDM77814.1 hypothetical protein PRIPAC_34681 [Pristionchus pacificus]